MKLQHPTENFKWTNSISQLFGVNSALYKKNFNIPGHNGIDYFWPGALKRGYGSKILAAHDGYIREIEVESRIRTRGNGIILSSNDNKFETIYWHLSEFTVRAGQQVKAGDVIGLSGNTGFVFPLPTEDNPYLGTHLHFGLKQIGLENDYYGFIDPTPFLYNENDKLPMKWNRDLFWHKEGDDVAWLQTCLKLEISELNFEPNGYFGSETLKFTRELQKKYGLTPTIGYFGPKTRKLLADKYL